MTWVRMDDGEPEHPKVLMVGPLAYALHCSARAYCNRQLTDGFIPAGKLSGLLDAEHPDLDGVSLTELAQRLVDARPPGHEHGLWETREGGWAIHDYLDYQPSREKVLSERARDRQRKSEKASGPRSARNPAGIRTDSEGPTRPNPSPTPTPEPTALDEQVRDVCRILQEAPRLKVNPAEVAKSMRVHPRRDPTQAAKIAVAWASSPEWRKTNGAGVLLDALGKMEDAELPTDRFLARLNGSGQ